MAEYNPSKIIKDGNTYNFRDTTKIPLAGSNQISGSLIPSTTDTVNLGSATNNYNVVYTQNIFHGLSSRSLILSGGNGTTNGANLVLYGKNRTDGFQGNFTLTVNDGTNSYILKGHQSGTLYWSGNVIRSSADNTCNLGSSAYNFKMLYTKGITIDGTQFLPSDYIPRSGGAVLTGVRISKTTNDSEISLDGGTGYQDGATIALYGKNINQYLGG